MLQFIGGIELSCQHSDLQLTVLLTLSLFLQQTELGREGPRLTASLCHLSALLPDAKSLHNSCLLNSQLYVGARTFSQVCLVQTTSNVGEYMLCGKDIKSAGPPTCQR